MENGRIQDNQITASSYWHQSAQSTNPPRFARLNLSSYWSAASATIGQWIQVNLGVSRFVSGIILQGSTWADQRVTAYQVQYSLDGSSWLPVKQANQQNVKVGHKSAMKADIIHDSFNVKMSSQIENNGGRLSTRTDMIFCMSKLVSHACVVLNNYDAIYSVSIIMCWSII